MGGKRLEEASWCLHFMEVRHYKRESAPQRPPLQKRMERYESWLRDPNAPLWLKTEGRHLLGDSNLDILLDFVRLEPEVQEKAITRGYPGLIEALEWMTQMVNWVYQEREGRERKVRRRRQRGDTDLERESPKREEAEHPQPKREEPVRPQPKREEAEHPQPKREEPVCPQPKRGEAECLQPTSPPAEGEFLLVPPPSLWEDWVSLPPLPAEGEFLLVPPPLPWEDCESLPPPPAEGEFLLVPPPPPWEDGVSLPPPPAEGACLLVLPSQPEGEEALLPWPPEGEEPLPPSQPEGEELPSQPEGEEPPSQPEGEEPLQPSQPALSQQDRVWQEPRKRELPATKNWRVPEIPPWPPPQKQLASPSSGTLRLRGKVAVGTKCALHKGGDM
ncbi:UNVERIFIED_CONTAM: hypothetical protein FKN15_057557 [Acipenser sinensis]